MFFSKIDYHYTLPNRLRKCALVIVRHVVQKNLKSSGKILNIILKFWGEEVRDLFKVLFKKKDNSLKICYIINKKQWRIGQWKLFLVRGKVRENSGTVKIYKLCGHSVVLCAFVVYIPLFIHLVFFLAYKYFFFLHANIFLPYMYVYIVYFSSNVRTALKKHLL